MFDYRLTQTAARGCMLAVCLALLAGCGGGGGGQGPTGVTPPAATTPAAPANLQATAGDAQASLTWSASSGATSYSVKRSTTSGGPYSQVSTPTSTAYSDISVTNGTMYYYVVSAVDTAGESANSAEASARPTAPPTSAPAVPSGVAATAGNAQVALQWSASSGATSYSVKRSTTSGGPYSQVSTPTSTAYSDISVTNGTMYYYVVSAVDTAGESANSAEASARPMAPPTAAPAVPSGVAATAGNAQVALQWSASSGATSYHVKRATVSGGPYAQIGAPTSATYTDSPVTNSTTYYYVVSAVNSIGESNNSAEVSALPADPAVTPPPTAFGTWVDVTPAGVAVATPSSCGNYGTQSAQVDPAHPSNIYTMFMCQGVWKSTDYGATWTGPINTGTNGALITDCAGGITMGSNSSASVPTLYDACIRGSGLGFWKSVDGGVNWTSYAVTPSGAGHQDFYPPVVDPYDVNHLLMAAHEQNLLVQSVDGGQTWSSVALNAGMMENGGTGGIFFINNGTATSTRGLWLWIAQGSGGNYGTWRTTDSGTTWLKVDKNEHPHGSSQIFQPDNNGVVYIAGSYSDLGNGVLRSADYGQTWTHVGSTASGETVVIGTSKNVYAMFGWAIGIGNTVNAAFEIAAKPGTGTWASPVVPAGLSQGAAQLAAVNDGSHNIIVGAMWNGGMWRYVEP